MSIRADVKYNGVVGPGSQLYETQAGTLGYQVMLECRWEGAGPSAAASDSFFFRMP